jgi:hypothetical protein
MPVAVDAWDELMAREPMLAADLARRVAAGEAMLDRVRPGWRGRVAADAIAMESCDRCILAQVLGSYEAGYRSLLPSLTTRLHAASEYGFTLPVAAQRGDRARALARFAALGDLWRRVLAARPLMPWEAE